MRAQAIDLARAHDHLLSGHRCLRLFQGRRGCRPTENRTFLNGQNRTFARSPDTPPCAGSASAGSARAVAFVSCFSSSAIRLAFGSSGLAGRPHA